jgi:hypothetical protein
MGSIKALMMVSVRYGRTLERGQGVEQKHQWIVHWIRRL